MSFGNGVIGKRCLVWLGLSVVAVTLVAVVSTAWACSPSASIGVQPNSGPAASVATVAGQGFLAGKPVEIRWNSVSGPVLAERTGPTFSAQVSVPATAPGYYYFVALARNDDGTIGGKSSAAFQVTASTETSTTTSTTTTTTTTTATTATTVPLSTSQPPGSTEPATSAAGQDMTRVETAGSATAGSATNPGLPASAASAPRTVVSGRTTADKPTAQAQGGRAPATASAPPPGGAGGADATLGTGSADSVASIAAVGPDASTGSALTVETKPVKTGLLIARQAEGGGASTTNRPAAILSAALLATLGLVIGRRGRHRSTSP